MSMLGKAFKTIRISKSITNHAPTRRYNSFSRLTAHLPRFCTKLLRRCAGSNSSGKHRSDESVQKTLATLSILRDHARQIDVVKDNLVEPVPDIINNELLGLPNGSFRKHVDAEEVETWNGPLKQLFKNVPESLETKLNDMAVSSIKFSIDVDKSELVNHILAHANKTPINELYNQPTPLSFKTIIQGTIELDSKSSVQKFLDGEQMSEFSEKINDFATALCRKSMQKVFLDNGARMHFSTNSISVSSNIKSITIGPNNDIFWAKQNQKSRGLSIDGGSGTSGSSCDKNKTEKVEENKMMMSSDKGDDKFGKVNYPPMQKKKTELISCSSTKEKGCISPGNADLPKWPSDKLPTSIQKVNKTDDKFGKVNYPPMQKKKAELIACAATKEKGCLSPGNAHLANWPSEDGNQTITIKFASMSELIGERGCWDLMSRDVYNRALREAAKRREYMFTAEQPCLKDDDVPYRKVPSPCKTDPKSNPCEKPKEESSPRPCPKPCPKMKPPKPCKSEGVLELIPNDKCDNPSQSQTEMLCAKKKSPCKNQSEYPFMKDDPCKKKDPCKKDDPCKKKEDPCKKKEDPCKKKEDPCKKKEDPCKKKEDPCKKKEDPCKKTEDPCKKKEDPCKKKEDPSKKKEDPSKKKEDPCKKKEDPCKKKVDPCKKKPEPCKEEDPCKKKEKKESPCKTKEKKDPKKKEPCCEPRKEPCKRDPCKKKDPCKKASSNERDEVCARSSCESNPKLSKKGKEKKKKNLARARMAKCCLKPTEKTEPQSMADFISEMCCRRAEAEKAKQCSAAQPAPKKSDPATPTNPVSNKSKAEDVKAKAKMAKTSKKAKASGKFTCGKRSDKTAPNCKNKTFGKNDKRAYSTSTIVASLIDSFLKPNQSKLQPISMRFKHNDDKKTPDSSCLRNQKADKARPVYRKDIKYPTWKNCWNEPDGTDQCPLDRCKKQSASDCRNKNPSGEPCRKRSLKKSGCLPGNPEQPGCAGSAGKKGENVELNQKYILNSNNYYKSHFPNNYILKEFKRYMSSKQHGQPLHCNEMETCSCDDSMNEECKNEVAVVTDAGVVVKERTPLPALTDYDALIRVEAIALSGSDIHVFESGGRNCPGITLGHDASGIVESVGQHVQNLKPGDRVAIESGLSCGICGLCKSGAYNMCSQMIYNGFLSKYQVHPADLCYKLPEGVTCVEAALTNTLAMGCQACFKANITPLTNVLIIGSSATALSAAFCARALGANNICLTCNMKDSLSMIKRGFGFDYVHYDQHTPLTQILETIHAKLQNWPNVAINCSISEWTMNMAVMVLQPSGTCILAECESECCSFNAMDVLMKNLKLIPSFRNTNMFQTAIYLIDRGYAPMAQIISECFDWKYIDAAFRAAQHEANIGNKKVIVKCSDMEDCYLEET